MAETVLVADASIRFLDKTRVVLEKAGYKVLSALDWEDARNAFRRRRPDLVLCGARLPPGSGDDLVRFVKKQDPTVPCVLLFGEDGEEPRTITRETGAENWLVRPLKKSELLATVRGMAEIRRLKRELAELTRQEPAPQAPGDGIFDARTGFYTFAHFKQLLFLEVKRARRHRIPLGLALIEFDSQRRPAGVPAAELEAHLWGGLAIAVRRSLRDIDIPVAYGKSQILVLMPHTDLEGARVVAERIRERVGQSRLKLARTSLEPTVSVGIAAASQLGGETFSVLVKEAAASLRRAVDDGGDTVV